MAMSKREKNDVVLHAVSHPLRRKILRLMEQNANGGISPKQLTDGIPGESLGTVAYHTRLLVASGLVKLVNTKQRRGALEHFYVRAGNTLDKRVSEMLNLLGKD